MAFRSSNINTHITQVVVVVEVLFMSARISDLGYKELEDSRKRRKTCTARVVKLVEEGVFFCYLCVVSIQSEIKTHSSI